MSADRRSNRAEVARRRLLDAGLALLDELPYAEITVTMVAKRAGVARGLMFYYFADKDAFFHAVIHAFLEERQAAFLANDPAAATDPGAWLEAEVGVFLAVLGSHPRAMRTIVELAPPAEDAPGGPHAGHFIDFTVDRLRRAFDLPVDDPLLDAVLRSWGAHCVHLVRRVQETGAWDLTPVGAVLVAELRAALHALEVWSADLR